MKCAGRALALAELKVPLACIVILLICGMLTGCDVDDIPKSLGLSRQRYELKRDKDGRMVRLDTQTGETTVLVGDKLIRVETPEERDAKQATLAALATPTNWGSIELKAFSSSAYVTTRLLDGRLHYQFTLAPASAALTKSIADASTAGHVMLKELRLAGGMTLAPRSSEPPRFLLQFFDEAGFKTISIPIPAAGLLRVADESRKTVKFEARDSVDCPAEQYGRSRAWNVSWEGL